MATLTFLANPNTDFSALGTGSGLGFYGAGGFGNSVTVGSWQGRTFVTDSNGVIQGLEARNVKYFDAGSGYMLGSSEPTGLLFVPNYQSTLNVRFEHATAISTQNAELRIYDRASINNAASGVTTKAVEVIHPGFVQDESGSGDDTWLTPAGSAIVVDLAPNPGVSGADAGDGVSSVASGIRHDWYVNLSASPDSIGSKTQYGLYVQLEYL